MSSAKSCHVRLNSKSFDLLRHINAMTSLDHDNNLCLVTLSFHSLTPSVASPTGSAPLSAKSTESTTPKKKSFDDIKNEIKNEVNELPKIITELENDSSNDPSKGEKATKLSSKLEALKTVNRLCDFANELTKTNSENILNNLCTGLETFLGFDSTSKGYTGQGIVYSDLDRLCDGVMGFLFEIISEVKENDNLSPYKEQLENAVNKLKRNLNKGKKGLRAVIGPVMLGIKTWVRIVNEQHDHVLRPLNNLNAKLDGHLLTYLENKPITEQLRNWQGFAGLYLTDIQSSENALTNIDENLVNKVTTNLQFIRQLFQNFWNSVNNSDVKSSVEATRNKLHQHRNAVDSYIGSQMQGIEQSLNEKYEKIDHTIDNLKKQKNSAIDFIAAAVKSAQKLTNDLLDGAANGFDQRYKRTIREKFNEIKTDIETFTNEQTRGEKAEILKNFDELATGIQRLDADVQGDLQALKKGIGDLAADVQGTKTDDDIVKEAVEDLDDDKHELDKTTAAVTAKSEALKNKYVAFTQEIKDLSTRFPAFIDAVYGKGGSSNAPLENSFAQHIIALTDAIVETGNGQLQSAITKFHGDAAQRIRDAANAAIEKAIEKFNMSTGGDLPTINLKEMMNLFYHTKARIDDSLSLIGGELVKLKRLPRTVQQATDTAEQIMEDLKNEITIIQNAIDGINKVINDAEESLDAAIEGLQIALHEARNTASVKLQELKITLQLKLRNAFNDVEEHVQKMYDEQKKAELRALQTSLTDQISTIDSVIVDDMDTGLKGLMNKLQEPLNKLHGSGTRLRPYVGKVKMFCEEFFGDLKSQPDHSPLLTPLADALSSLLSTMHDQRHFDHAVSRKLFDLQTQLTNLSPTQFAEASPLLNVVRAGVRAFHGELAKQYVSRYAGREVGEMVKPKTSSESKTLKVPAKTGDNTEITEYGRKCAKVFLTLVETVFNDLVKLRLECTNTWSALQINTYDSNSLGDFLNKLGYKVNSENGKQHGELRDKAEMNGTKIDENLKTNLMKDDVLNRLKDYLVHYYYVCHLEVTPSPKAPTTVFHMLKWCAGLRYNPMLSKVEEYTKTLFSKPKNQENSDYKDISVNDLQLVGTSTIKPRDLCDTIYDVCRYAKTILIAILGHGHNDGVYACDFSANEDGFSYPVNPADCFDTLVDVAYRLHDQLYFLLVQCQRTSKANSWRDCWYGRYVGGSDWRCNEKQRINQMVNQSADQKANQTCGQTCEQHRKCGVKSPLQSFLEDGLPGFLPHRITSVGCGVKCSLGNHGGLTCKTPMGFVDISNVASHTKMGAEIGAVLSDFCGQPRSPLRKMCSYFIALTQRPPQTLGDMFSFYYNFLYGWNNAGKDHRNDAFDGAVAKAYFGVSYEDLDPSVLFSSSHINKHERRDLVSLICPGSTQSVTICGRYLQPFGQDTWNIFSREYADKYLSWIVYLTETFYNLLDKLYEECCNNCTKVGSRCHGKVCVENCKVKSYYKLQESTADTKPSAAAPTDMKHDTLCKSIATCPFVRPTLSKYGFVFRSLSNMSGINGAQTIRTCKDLCNALKNVLSNKIDENAPLAKLIHVTIPQFLWDIRSKFFWLNVALWLLSLLYLIHIMVIRLDLLHIKSHLHSPSSHRIAAQSLLAAGRVNKLNRVFYLQP